MRTQLYIDGELRTVDIEDGRITTVNEEPKEVEIKTGWEHLELMQRYYMTNGESQPETYHPEDTKRYENADYFGSSALAADIARAQTIWRKLMRWQAENDSMEDVPFGRENNRYVILYENTFGVTFGVKDKLEANEAFSIYFLSENSVCKAVETFHDDLLWLFTEFKYRLDGGAE